MREELDQLAMEELSEISTARNYPKNAIIITEGDQSDALYVIVSGRVKVFLINDNGKEVILNFHGPNEYFGEIAMLDEKPRSASVIALEKCKFAIISKANFWQCLKDNPEMAFSVIRKLALRIRELTDNVKDLALTDVYGRLVKLLNQMSVPSANGERIITQSLTQQDLANLIGSSREMITRIMKDLVAGGYVNNKNMRITIKKKLPPAW